MLILAFYLTSRLDSANAVVLETQRGLSRTTASTVEGRPIKGYPQAVDNSIHLWKSHAKQIITITWNSDEWKYFQKIIYKESRWNPQAFNPSTNAYGLGQLINSKRYTKDMPYKQINAAVKYIYNRYKTPALAWKHHIKWGWY